jgi:antitoxin (DNA-binding transcriptional repressor) of toxin-antitoxin stability system
MTVLTATQLARNLDRVLDRLEHGGEEVLIVRGDQPLARLLPGTPTVTAHEFLSDLYGVLTDEEGEAWLNDMKGMDRTLDEELHDPWE